jgi:hypothetical protein
VLEDAAFAAAVVQGLFATAASGWWYLQRVVGG